MFDRKVILEIVNTVLQNNDLPLLSEWDDTLKLREDLGLDSIMLAELTVRVEDKTSTDIFENGLVLTLGEIVGLLES